MTNPAPTETGERYEESQAYRDNKADEIFANIKREVGVMDRATYLPAPHIFNLNQACAIIGQALDHSVYLVGSALERRDYRDVDVRAILDDAQFDHLFPGLHSGIASLHPLWSLMCSSISLYLQQHSGLPVDFQIQRMSDANAKYTGPRYALGMFYRPEKNITAALAARGGR